MGSGPSQGRKPANRGPRTADRRSGFTLLELILVLMIVGLGAALAAARLSSMRGSVGVEMAAQSFIDQARRCQHLAATSGQSVRMRLDPTARTLHIAQLDGTKEQKPGDGDDARVELAHSADDLVVAFARGDGVKASSQESADAVDFLFSPDRRCDPAGIVTFAAKSRSTSVQLSGGARLPRLVAQAPVTP